MTAMKEKGVVVFSRLRRDAALFDRPPERTGQRGRPRIYGEQRVNLSKRAGVGNQLLIVVVAPM